MTSSDHTPAGGTPAGHPDFEALSAHLDGEAPEWDAHLRRCPTCRADLDRLRAVSSAVAAPVAPPAQFREQALARALAAATTARQDPEAATDAAAATDVATGDGAGPVPVTVDSRRRPKGMAEVILLRRRAAAAWTAVGAVAATVMAVVAVGLLWGTGDGDDGTVAAGGPPAPAATESRSAIGSAVDGPGEQSLAEGAGESAPGGTAAAAPPVTGSTPDGVAGGGGGDVATAAGRAGSNALPVDVAHLGELGDVADEADLLAKLQAARLAHQARPAPEPAGPAASPGPEVHAVPPCEAKARGSEPGLGRMAYLATASFEGAPVVVLAFESGEEPPTLTLLAMTQPDACRVVLRAAGP